MSLADDIKAGPERTLKGPVCVTGGFMMGLSTEDRAAMLAALADRRWTGKQIAELLHRHFDVQIPPDTLNRHRRGDCACPRSAAT